MSIAKPITLLEEMQEVKVTVLDSMEPSLVQDRTAESSEMTTKHIYFFLLESYQAKRMR